MYYFFCLGARLQEKADHCPTLPSMQAIIALTLELVFDGFAITSELKIGISFFLKKTQQTWTSNSSYKVLYKFFIFLHNNQGFHTDTDGKPLILYMVPVLLNTIRLARQQAIRQCKAYDNRDTLLQCTFDELI